MIKAGNYIFQDTWTLWKNIEKGKGDGMARLINYEINTMMSYDFSSEDQIRKSTWAEKSQLVAIYRSQNSINIVNKNERSNGW